MKRIFHGIAVLTWIWAGTGTAQTDVSPSATAAAQGSATTVLDLPRLAALQDHVVFFLDRSQTDRAAALVREAFGQTPDLPELYILGARVRLAQNDPEGALIALERAVDKGYAGLDTLLHMPPFTSLRTAADARGLVTRSAAAPDRAAAHPAQKKDGVLFVSPDTLNWNSDSRRFHIHTDLPPATRPAPLPAVPKKTPEHERAARIYLNRLIHQGQAAGLGGLLYDNRDNGHSTPDLAGFPGLTAVTYGGALRERRLNYGLGNRVLFDRPTIGNSSTAHKGGTTPRSLPRSAMTRPPGALQAYQNYLANHFYVYPEHRDHDAVDRFPANWPYAVISQGSSYKDRPFVEAALWTTAAMTPETRAHVEREGLVVPTLQMILRRSQAHIRSPEAYLSGAAHPTVFQQDALRLDRMVALAQSLTPETVPPAPVFDILSESFAPRAGLAQLSERLFDTPAAVARVWRGFEWEKDMVLRAGAFGAANPQNLEFEWVLLRGDPERVRIEPLDEQGTRAKISLNWHDRRPVAPRAKRLTDRVDIGLFIRSGAMLSAPAFLSISFPTHQSRTYAPDAQGVMQLTDIDYGSAPAGRYYDPLLHWTAPWRDTYDTSGNWIRQYHDGRPTQRFGADGRPLSAPDTALRYVLRTREAQRILLEDTQKEGED